MTKKSANSKDLKAEDFANTSSNPVYVVEVAKSARSICRRCNSKIDGKEVRIGVMIEGDWGLFTRWQHLNCTVFHSSVKSPELLDGFNELKSTDKILVTERFKSSLTQVDEDHLPVNPDEMVRKTWDNPVEPGPDLLMPLLSYQKEGLGWMLHQEHTVVHGGILADEMGMGKTIQAIALMLGNRPHASAKLDKHWENSDIAHGHIGRLCRAGTLIVLPTVAIRQWESEIARFTRDGALTVRVYHGSDRSLTAEDLNETDIVITSYKILEIEYRKATAGTKVTCRVCNKKFYPDKLRVHRQYYCGAGAQRTEAQMRTQTKKDRQRRGKEDDQSVAEESHSEEEERTVSVGKRKATAAKASTAKKSAAKKPRRCGVASDDEEEEEEEYWPVEKKSRGGKLKGKGTASQRKSAKRSACISDDGGEERSGSEYTESESESVDSDGSECVAAEKSKACVPAPPRKPGRFAMFARARSQKQEETVVDSEVERDISRAVKAAAKASAPTQSVLHQVSWFRIILDEAHLIKDRSTSTSKAMFNLVSLHKWCLTGTPLQNRVGELYSLIRFLRVDPHAYYFCKAKGCDCKSLHYRFAQGKCEECQHSVMQHFCHFNKHVLNPIKKCGYVAEGRLAMLKLKQQILDEILLRRTKTSRADDILLPPRVVRVRQEKLDDKEEDFYQALYTQSQAQFNTYLASGTVLNNYAHIFDILIRLRQAVDHPYLVIHSDSQTSKTLLSTSSAAGADNDVAGEDCDLCHEPMDDPVVARCGHSFCRSCADDYVLSLQEESPSAAKILCPDCAEPLSLILGTDPLESGGSYAAPTKSSSQAPAIRESLWDVDKRRKKSILNRVDLSSFQSSTKMEALMEELHLMQSQDLGAKAIVFSQFVNMLDLLEYRLERGGIRCVKLLGSLNLDQRDKALVAFKEDPGVKVLLISLKAGGMALNLTVASRIFLMDPWWNPAAEMQAIDRTHRIGQHKPIFATRFIVENSIEERILRLQEKKKLVFDGTVGGDPGSMSKLTVDDMRFLFQ